MMPITKRQFTSNWKQFSVNDALLTDKVPEVSITPISSPSLPVPCGSAQHMQLKFSPEDVATITPLCSETSSGTSVTTENPPEVTPRNIDTITITVIQAFTEDGTQAECIERNVCQQKKDICIRNYAQNEETSTSVSTNGLKQTWQSMISLANTDVPMAESQQTMAGACTATGTEISDSILAKKSLKESSAQVSPELFKLADYFPKAKVTGSSVQSIQARNVGTESLLLQLLTNGKSGGKESGHSTINTSSVSKSETYRPIASTCLRRTRHTKNKTGRKVQCRPARNAYIVFSSEWREKVAKQFPLEDSRQISVRLGNMWQALPYSEKEQYYAVAKEAAEKTEKVSSSSSSSCRKKGGIPAAQIGAMRNNYKLPGGVRLNYEFIRHLGVRLPDDMQEEEKKSQKPDDVDTNDPSLHLLKLLPTNKIPTFETLEKSKLMSSDKVEPKPLVDTNMTESFAEKETISQDTYIKEEIDMSDEIPEWEIFDVKSEAISSGPVATVSSSEDGTSGVKNHLHKEILSGNLDFRVEIDPKLAVLNNINANMLQLDQVTDTSHENVNISQTEFVSTTDSSHPQEKSDFPPDCTYHVLETLNMDTDDAKDPLFISDNITHSEAPKDETYEAECQSSTRGHQQVQNTGSVDYGENTLVRQSDSVDVTWLHEGHTFDDGDNQMAQKDKEKDLLYGTVNYDEGAKNEKETIKEVEILYYAEKASISLPQQCRSSEDNQPSSAVSSNILTDVSVTGIADDSRINQTRGVHVLHNVHFSCQIGGSHFNNIQTFHEHQRPQSAERPYTCTRHGRSPKGVLCVQHRPIHTAGSRNMRGKYLSSTHVDQKPQSKHRKDLPFRCEICRMAFQSRKGLDQHMYLSHLTGPHTCSLCREVFTTLAEAQRHHQSHKDACTSLCEQCDTVNRLAAHQTQTHSRARDAVDSSDSDTAASSEDTSDFTTRTNFACGNCDENVVTCGDLVDHIHNSNSCQSVRRVPESDNISISCHCCEKKIENTIDFLTPLTIHKHEGHSELYRHTGRPFPLLICGNKFYRIQHLHKHKQIHTGEKAHVCNECGKRFRRNFGLHVHYQMHHKTKALTGQCQCKLCKGSVQLLTVPCSQEEFSLRRQAMHCDKCGRRCQSSGHNYADTGADTRFKRDKRQSQNSHCSSMFIPVPAKVGNRVASLRTEPQDQGLKPVFEAVQFFKRCGLKPLD